MTRKDLKHLRTEYQKHTLSTEVAGKNPFQLFGKWFEEAEQVELEANAMIVATKSEFPTCRVVLLKEVRLEEFVFYTNYLSEKGREIEANPEVSLLFFWQQLERQVRIRGYASKVSAQESDEYFASRPRESQLGAIASMQSSEIPNREDLENRFSDLTQIYEGKQIPRPNHWGGIAVKPIYFEFWQGRPSRLHDRITFEVVKDEWQTKRLSP